MKRKAAGIISIVIMLTISAFFIPSTDLIEARDTQNHLNQDVRSPVLCTPLPPPTGTVIQVSTVAELQSAVSNLTSNSTILIADGVYDLSNTLIIDGGVTDVTLRGASGNREAVVLRGRGMTNSSYGNTPHGFLIRKSNRVTIADLTIRDFYFHNVQIQGEQDAQATRLYNLKLIDAGEQLVKVSSGGPPAPYADDGVVECSYLGYTDRSRDWYTNGVDVLAGARWVIRDNVFENIRAPQGQLAGPAILMWRNSIDTIIERNLFIECDRAIAIGLSSPDPDRARDGNTQYDLHLAATAPVIDTVQYIPEVIDDFDGDQRPVGNAPDVGADEFRAPAPPPTFQDVPADHWAYVYIEALYQAGYIAGCSADPPLFCPSNPLDRALAAYMMVQAKGLSVP